MENSTWPDYVLMNIEEIKKDIKEIRKDIATVRTEIAVLKVKSGIWGFAAGAVPVAIALLLKLI